MSHAKLLAFSDLHLSEKFGLAGGNRRVQTDDTTHKKTRRRSLLEGARFLKHLAARAREEQPDAILFGGDLFDRANPTPNEEVVAMRGVLELADIAPVYLLLGNHTQTLGDSEHALGIFRELGDPRIRVIDRPECVDIAGDIALFCLPYPPTGKIVEDGDQARGWSSELRNGLTSDALGRIVERYVETIRHKNFQPMGFKRTPILFAHGTFAGCNYNDERVVPLSDVQIPTDLLHEFDAVVAGHLHKRQRIPGNDAGYYVGACDRWQFDHSTNPAGFAWIEAGEGVVEWRFEDYAQSRHFCTIDPYPFEIWAYDTLGEDYADTIDYDPTAHFDTGEMLDLDRCFVRVKGSTRELEYLDSLESLAARVVDKTNLGGLTLEVDVERDDRSLDAVEPGGGVRAIFDAYNDSRPNAIPADVREDVFDEVAETATLNRNGQ